MFRTRRDFVKHGLATARAMFLRSASGIFWPDYLQPNAMGWTRSCFLALGY